MTVYVFATNIYYMGLREMPSAPIPPFIVFLLLLGVIGVPACTAVGYLFTRSRMYQGNFNVNTLRNPYTRAYYLALLEQTRLLYKLTGETPNKEMMRSLEKIVAMYEAGCSDPDA